MTFSMKSMRKTVLTHQAAQLLVVLRVPQPPLTASQQQTRRQMALALGQFGCTRAAWLLRWAGQLTGNCAGARQGRADMALSAPRPY